ncbi:terminase large subunit [Brucepastera parasyntrophica]|uniref:terminase large subunit n=1 Tax=Brucepastera parasyntrophica TaxID=2880008 RepID=UPI00210C0661|nr:terminase TerL endonuclease subunit [Brucepastera parasyntrophica]ULQ59229.1 terminase large subunit [Brucepastera parasyntrophica]
MGHAQTVRKYCNDILKKRIKSCIWVQLAIKRYFNDLKRVADPAFPYMFDAAAADEIIDFAESLVIPDIQKEDKRLQLLPWMKFIYYQLYGWRHKSDPEKRRFRQGYNEIARKNSKTTSLLFPPVLYDFLTTDSAESYFVTKDGDQSEKAYNELLNIIKEDRALNEAVNSTVKAITYKYSRIAFFSSESGGIDSYKNSMSVIDEFHAYDTDKIVTAFRYGGRARKNNLVLIITSAGNNIASPCYAENKKCKEILKGTITDDTYFGIIYAYDEGDDWKDPANFIKANPSLGEILTPETLEADLKDALLTPSHQPDFKSKTCGIWTNGTVSWIPLEKWRKNYTKKIDSAELSGASCCAAFDLSSVNDFTAKTLYFLYGTKYTALHTFYIPEETIYERYTSENINILEWINEGYVTVIPGSTIDYSYIYADLLNDAKTYDIREIAYDRWKAGQLTELLEEKLPHIDFIDMDQSLRSLSQPTKDFEKAIRDGNIIDNNPVMEWMIGNAVIRPDANENYKPLKENKTSKKESTGLFLRLWHIPG